MYLTPFYLRKISDSKILMNILINASAALRFAVLANPDGVQNNLLSVDAVRLMGGKPTGFYSEGEIAFDDLLGAFSAHLIDSFGDQGRARPVDYDLLLRHIEAYKNNLYGLHLRQQGDYSVVVEALRDFYVSRFSFEIFHVFSSFDSCERAGFEKRIQSPLGPNDYCSESLDLADFYSTWCAVVS